MVLNVPLKHVKYWTGSKARTVPAKRVEVLFKLRDRMDDIVDYRVHIALEHDVKKTVLRRVVSQEQLDKHDQTRGIPIGAYAMLTAWTMDRLQSEDIEVEVKWS